MTEKEEQAYMQGQRAAWMTLFNQCLRNLDIDTAHAQQWFPEREEAIAALRELCREYGDNDWPENLHLADIINKHLGKYLERRFI